MLPLYLLLLVHSICGSQLSSPTSSWVGCHTLASMGNLTSQEGISTWLLCLFTGNFPCPASRMLHNCLSPPVGLLSSSPSADRCRHIPWNSVFPENRRGAEQGTFCVQHQVPHTWLFPPSAIKLNSDAPHWGFLILSCSPMITHIHLFFPPSEAPHIALLLPCVLSWFERVPTPTLQK